MGPSPPLLARFCLLPLTTLAAVACVAALGWQSAHFGITAPSSPGADVSRKVDRVTYLQIKTALVPYFLPLHQYLCHTLNAGVRLVMERGVAALLVLRLLPLPPLLLLRRLCGGSR